MKTKTFASAAVAVLALALISTGANAEENKSNSQSNQQNSQKSQRQENFNESGVRSFGFPVANWTDNSGVTGKSDNPAVSKDQQGSDKEFLSYITQQVKQARAAAVGSSATNPISCHGSCSVYSGSIAIIPVWAGSRWDSNNLSNWNDILSKLVNSLGTKTVATTGTSNVFGTNGVGTIGLTTGYFSKLLSPATPPTLSWFDNTDVTPIPNNATNVSDNAVGTVINNFITSHPNLNINGAKPIYVYIGAFNTRLSSGFGTRYCGWHTYGTSSTLNRIPYIAIQDFTTTDLSACARQTVSPNGNAQLDAMASVLVHEIDESITDPYLNAWYDARGAENADKCAWTFGATTTITTTGALHGALYNFSVGSVNYLIQQNWLATNKVTVTGTSNSTSCSVTN